MNDRKVVETASLHLPVQNASTKSSLKKFAVRHKDALIATAILSPMILWWLVLSGFPTLFGFFLGFFDWIGIAANPKFVWFDNYVRFFHDPLYYEALWRSIWLGGLVTAITLIAGFGAALLMNMPLFGKGIYRSIWYIPAVTSTVATTQIFNLLLDTNNGVINNFLKSIGKEPIVWQYSVFWGVFWIVVYSVWKGVGGAALIWLAGLQSVDVSLYEAAEIDGAGRWGKLWNVTLPGLKPIATYIVITSLIGAIQIYEQVLFMTGGGPYGKTEVLVFRIYRDAFWDFNLGMAGASSLIMAVIVFLVTIAYYRWSTNSDRSTTIKIKGVKGGPKA
ncbi:MULTISPECIES: carbohydrate ABC transporter permease [Paenibacillus]|uniref:ABC transporter permease n=1 Tax=Paenibacillus glycanilyticus TaxID=126569 RepID=A0ABQ6NWM2_9BACL|nr:MULTISPECIES: sugar ABC transporter permease [Paenibacillus]MCK9861721.1 sugar ABC transporter permease [Paenibacillus sp. ATY16]GMK48955.1 ABC transporter permease [Paenibacillus glycanilyticus]